MRSLAGPLERPSRLRRAAHRTLKRQVERQLAIAFSMAFPDRSDWGIERSLAALVIE